MTDLPITLDSDERLLWSGAPRRGVVFRGGDVLLIPFSLLFLGFALLFHAVMWTARAPWFMWLLLFPFLAAGLYGAFGRFWADAWVRGNTRYAVTTKRVVIATHVFRARTKLLQLRTLTDVMVDIEADGSGTISFGKPSYQTALIGSTPWPGVVRPLSFDLIPHAKQVYEIIGAAQREAATPIPARPTASRRVL